MLRVMHLIIRVLQKKNKKERGRVRHTLKASSSVLSSPIYTGRISLQLLNPNVSRKYSTAFPLFHFIEGLISITYK